MLPLGPLMAHGPSQSRGLMATAHTLENCDAIPTDSSEEASPDRVLGFGEQLSALRHARLIDRRLLCVRLEPGGGEDVGEDEGAGFFLRHGRLRYTDSCDMGGWGRRSTGRGRERDGGRRRRGGSEHRESVWGCWCHWRRRGQIHFDVKRRIEVGNEVNGAREDFEEFTPVSDEPSVFAHKTVGF